MRRILFIVLALLFLIGCGGGGGGGGSHTPGVPLITGATFKIAWPAHSRGDLDLGLTSALSAKVVLANASATGSDVTMTVVRDPAPAAYVGTYTVPVAIRAQVGVFQASFYASPDSTGTVVGTASGSYTPSGTDLGIGTVTVVGKVKSVTPLSPGSLVEGATPVQLIADADDANGSPVAVAAGSFHWTVTNGSSAASVTDDGLLTPLQAGTADIQVSIDGLTGSRTITIASAPVTGASFKIVWPARTRAALDHGLTSAQSAKVVFVAADPSGSDVTVDVNRDPADLTLHTETYSVPTAVQKSVSSMTATFYALPDQTGAVVGTASAQVSLTGTDFDFGTIVVSGTVKSVTVLAPSGLIAGGSSVQIQASALDSAGEAVAVTPGSFQWSVVSGSSFLSLTPDGVATPVAAGSAQVRAAVDGMASASTMVTVSAPPPSASTLSVEANDLAYDSVANRIWAVVPANASTNANSLVAIDPATGAVTQSISLGVEASHIAVTDNGQFAYVAVDADSTIRRVDLSNGSVAIYSVNEGRSYVDLIAVPGQPHSFAVAIDPSGGVNLSVWDDGVRRSGTGAVGYRMRFANDGTTIYGDGGDSLFTDVIAPGTVSWTGQTTLNVSGFDYSKADGLLYTAAGKVFDPATNTLIAQLSTTNVLFDKGVQVGDTDNRVYFVTWDSGIGKRILSFDRTTKQELAPFNTGVIPGGAQDLVACGSHTVAFHLFGSGVAKNVVLIRNLP